MAELNRKRKATDQLSPYTEDIPSEHKESEKINTSKTEQNEPTSVFKKARVKKDVGVSNPSLKGIFGSVSLKSDEGKKTTHSKDEMIAGLNNSLVKCIEKILKHQSNRDLTYIFVQYSKYLRDIDENSK